MRRTNTSAFTLFPSLGPESATFDFSIPKNIRITIPRSSTWRTNSHWHSLGEENCLLLHVEAGEMQVDYHKEPRTGGAVIGAGDYKFKPGYWTSWSRKQTRNEELIVRLIVRDEGLQRNICSAELDAEKFPHLNTTPYWLRGIFAALRPLPAARMWLVRKMCYVQLQVIFYEHQHWEYHGGINAVSWWQWTHPFDVGRHPAWTVSLQYRSQKFFSKFVQGLYYRIGTHLFGMRGDYPEYNSNFHDISKTKEEDSRSK